LKSISAPLVAEHPRFDFVCRVREIIIDRKASGCLPFTAVEHLQPPVTDLGTTLCMNRCRGKGIKQVPDGGVDDFAFQERVVDSSRARGARFIAPSSCRIPGAVPESMFVVDGVEDVGAQMFIIASPARRTGRYWWLKTGDRGPPPRSHDASERMRQRGTPHAPKANWRRKRPRGRPKHSIIPTVILPRMGVRQLQDKAGCGQ